MNPDHDPIPTARLSDADARLLDLLIEQGPAALPADDPRTGRLLALWALIGAWPAGQPGTDLVRRTLRGLMRAEVQTQVVDEPALAPIHLSPADADLLDTLAQLGQLRNPMTPLPPGSTDRAAALRGLLGLLDHASQERALPASDLSARTLAHIAGYERNLRLPHATDLPARAGSGFFASPVVLRRLGSVAALLLICLSVLLPVLDSARQHAQAVACQDNLRVAGRGLAAYSEAHDGLLPQNAANTFSLLSRFADDAAEQSPADGAMPASRINLFLLPRQGYVAASELACPAVAPEQRQSAGGYYNAQNAIAGGPIRLDELDAPLLADNNPLYALTGNGLTRQAGLRDDTPSANHNATGQNILARDASVRWTLKPVVSTQDRADNLWINDARPGQPDAFLTP